MSFSGRKGSVWLFCSPLSAWSFVEHAFWLDALCANWCAGQSVDHLDAPRILVEAGKSKVLCLADCFDFGLAVFD